MGRKGRIAWSVAAVLTSHIAFAQPFNRKTLPSDVREALVHAKRFELYSLYPSFKYCLSQPADSNCLSGWKILGHTTVWDAGQRTALLDALDRGVWEREENGMAHGCVFKPRHAIRLEHRGEVITLLICFECGDVAIEGPGRQVRGVAITGDPHLVFDRLLEAAGVTLATKGRPFFFLRRLDFDRALEFEWSLEVETVIPP